MPETHLDTLRHHRVLFTIWQSCFRGQNDPQWSEDLVFIIQTSVFYQEVAGDKSNSLDDVGMLEVADHSLEQEMDDGGDGQVMVIMTWWMLSLLEVRRRTFLFLACYFCWMLVLGCWKRYLFAVLFCPDCVDCCGYLSSLPVFFWCCYGSVI